jgi:hypothetical protein
MVSVFTIMIGHIFMAFFAEFGFRSYLQNIVESKVNPYVVLIVQIEYIKPTMIEAKNVLTLLSTIFCKYDLLIVLFYYKPMIYQYLYLQL